MGARPQARPRRRGPLPRRRPMALVSYVEKDQAAEAIRPAYDNVEKKLGSMLNFLKVLAHNPGVFQTFLAFDAAAARTELPAALRELAYIKASEVNDCGYCLHYHRARGQKVGLTGRQIEEIGRFESSDAFDDLQKDVLR